MKIKKKMHLGPKRRDCHGLRVRVAAGAGAGWHFLTLRKPAPASTGYGFVTVRREFMICPKKLKNWLKKLANINIFLVNVIVTHFSFKMSPKTLNLVKI